MSPCVESVASRSRAERGRPMTPKQRVLKKWPNAWCWKSDAHDRLYYIEVPGRKPTEFVCGGTSPRDAWADAARRIRK